MCVCHEDFFYRFMKALKNLVGLDRNAGVNACLSRIRQLIVLQTELYNRTLEQPNSKGNRPDKSAFESELVSLLDVESVSAVCEEVSKLKNRVEEAEAALREHEGPIKELYDIFGVDDLSEIVKAAGTLATATSDGNSNASK